MAEVSKNDGQRFSQQQNALIAAAQSGDLESVRAAFAKLGSGGLGNLPYRRDAPLEIAVVKGHVEVVEYLLKAGANPQPREGEVPLIFIAAFDSNIKVVQLLLSAGADANQCHNGRSLLHSAASNGQLDVVQCLIEWPCQINLDGPIFDGHSPLSAAAGLGHTAIARCLVEAGADIEHPRDCPPLIRALDKGKVEIARYLVGAGAAVARAGADDRYLTVAAAAGSVEMMEMLIAAGADLQSVSDGIVTGDVVLLAAAKAGSLAAAQFLIGAGVDVRKRPTTLGVSPLMLAVTVGNVELTRYLVQAGVDVNFADDYGSQPLDMAISKGNSEILSILKAAGAMRSVNQEEYRAAAIRAEKKKSRTKKPATQDEVAPGAVAAAEAAMAALLAEEEQEAAKKAAKKNKNKGKKKGVRSADVNAGQKAVPGAQQVTSDSNPPSPLISSNPGQSSASPSSSEPIDPLAPLAPLHAPGSAEASSLPRPICQASLEAGEGVVAVEAEEAGEAAREAGQLSRGSREFSSVGVWEGSGRGSGPGGSSGRVFGGEELSLAGFTGGVFQGGPAVGGVGRGDSRVSAHAGRDRLHGPDCSPESLRGLSSPEVTAAATADPGLGSGPRGPRKGDSPEGGLPPGGSGRPLGAKSAAGPASGGGDAGPSSSWVPPPPGWGPGRPGRPQPGGFQHGAPGSGMELAAIGALGGSGGEASGLEWWLPPGQKLASSPEAADGNGGGPSERLPGPVVPAVVPAAAVWSAPAVGATLVAPEPPAAAAPSAPERVPERMRDRFLCPITQELFKDPVFASDGFTYERSAIEDWISRKRTSPMTNEPLAHTFLTPNLAFRSMIHDMQEDGVGLPL